MDSRRHVFHRSVRFRLTAWYTTLLAVVIVAVGITLSIVVHRQLRKDVDARLLTTASYFINDLRIISSISEQTGTIQGDPFVLDPITSPGQVVQVVDRDGNLIRSSSDDRTNQPSTPLSAPTTSIVFRNSEVQEASVRILTYPLYSKDTGAYAGSMIVAESLEPVERTLRILERLLLFASPIGLVLSAFGGWFLAGRALNPVDKITTTAASIATGTHGQHSLATRLDVPNTGDEIARLATTFNQMLDRLEETFNAQRRFVADASHELRTPLTAIRGNIDVMMRQLQRGEVEASDLSDAMGDVRRESARMSRLIEDLLALARVDSPPDHMRRLTPIRVDEFVTDAMRTATGLAAGQNLRVAPLPSATIVADRDRMTELLLILLDNAIRHTPPGGAIVVAVEQTATTIRLSVRDTGEGIGPEDLPHVFDRFYRAGRSRDRATGGTGLGLAIAQSIARLHGGEITVTSTLGTGSTFTVTLPRAGLPSEDLRLTSRNAA